MRSIPRNSIQAVERTTGSLMRFPRHFKKQEEGISNIENSYLREFRVWMGGMVQVEVGSVNEESRLGSLQLSAQGGECIKQCL